MLKLHCVNTPAGLVPCDDDSYNDKQKLRLGHIYEVQVKTKRNYQFHKKYFALINMAWEYLPEPLTMFYLNKHNFRKDLELCAGSYERVYSIERDEWIEQHKSISFDKMSEEEFSELYERVKDVLFKVHLKNLSEYDKKEFTNNLNNF